MRIFCISDTHGLHEQIKIPKNIDMIIHAGDVGNSNVLHKSVNEIYDFLNWYGLLNIRYKIFIAGNHDTALSEPNYINVPSNICYLEHSSIEIEGIKIFGSPYTPRFGSWSFMKDRGKLSPYWEQIPQDTDILITHGPPKGILDLSYDKFGTLEYCGDQELLNAINKLYIKYHIFGHIHDSDRCLNAGTKTIKDLETLFINASSVTDGKIFISGITNNGYIIEYEN